MTSAPIILVPGFWLGAWAWDEVADLLRADGHDVTALTLPGLESVDTDRSAITLSDHVEAICDAVRAAGTPVVLAVHSGAAAPGYAATDRVPELVAHMVYVDTGPPVGALDLEVGEELPMPTLEELRRNEPLEGLSDEQLEEFARRAIPEPGGVLRDEPELTNDARLDIPSTVIATGYTTAQYKEAVEEGQSWLGALAYLRSLSWIDLPTSHWPMWSRPRELAEIIGVIATSTASDA
jgi:pimeloyl-ACP methyl ester carboxylesterase